MKPGKVEPDQWERRWRAPLAVLALVLLSILVAAIIGLVIVGRERQAPPAIAPTTTTTGAPAAVNRLPVGSPLQTFTIDSPEHHQHDPALFRVTADVRAVQAGRLERLLGA